MISKEQQLFKAFKKVSEQEWIAKIEKDLKGKPLSILNYSPEKEIQTKAYFHSDSAKNWQPLAQKPDNSWYVQEHFKGDNDTALNQTILKHLLNGTDAIQVNVSF
jgi:methylmalonyl-CoA mutase